MMFGVWSLRLKIEDWRLEVGEDLGKRDLVIGEEGLGI